MSYKNGIKCKWLKKIKKQINSENVATCLTFSWGRGSVCRIGRQLYWKKKKFLDL